jgi:hypothetical protein
LTLVAYINLVMELLGCYSTDVPSTERHRPLHGVSSSLMRLPSAQPSFSPSLLHPLSLHAQDLAVNTSSPGTCLPTNTATRGSDRPLPPHHCRGRRRPRPLPPNVGSPRREAHRPSLLQLLSPGVHDLAAALSSPGLCLPTAVGGEVGPGCCP